MFSLSRFFFRASIPTLLLVFWFAQPLAAQTKHAVKQGETLFSIARKYGVSVASLRQANHLTNNRLESGGVLVIPRQASSDVATPTRPAGTSAATSSAATYTVREGDTFFSIARRHGMKMGELKALNGLTTTDLKLGQTLKVTSGTARTASQTTPASVTKPATGAKSEHVVKSGETLYSIATKHGVKVDDVIQANGGTSFAAKSLHAGDVVKLPNAAKAVPRSHTVKSGDTLSNIADRYHVSTTTLKTANKIQGSIRAGDVLTIPVRERGLSLMDGVMKTPLASGKVNVDARSKGTPTQSGETYDPNQLYVAHGTLPLNSIVLISNRSSNRHTLARVVDKITGSTVMMTVSPKVAEALNVSGTAQVEVRMVKKGK